MGLANETVKSIMVVSQDTPNYMRLEVETEEGNTYITEGKNIVAIVKGKICAVKKGSEEWDDDVRSRPIVTIYALAHERLIRYKKGQKIHVPTQDEIMFAYSKYKIGTWGIDGVDECPWTYKKNQLEGWEYLEKTGAKILTEEEVNMDTLFEGWLPDWI